MADDDVYIEELVAAAPPLTPAQRDRLAGLLSASGADQPAARLQRGAGHGAG